MSDFSILASIDADDTEFQRGLARADAAMAKVEAKIAAAMSKIDKATAAAFRSAETESRRLQLALEKTFTVEGAEKARATATAALQVAKANREGAQAALGGARAADQATGSFERQRRAMDMLVKANRAYQAAQEAVSAAGQRVTQIEETARIERETLALQEKARAEEEAVRATAQLAAANESLRSRYVPLHAAQQAYLASLNEIRSAGVEVFRTEAERAAAITRTKDAFADQVRVINGTAGPLKDGAGRYRQMGAAVQQAGFQVGDFAVQVASGQGVLRPFIQQGTQLVSMFGPWGAAIGAAGAVVGALATYLIDAEDGMEKVAKAAGVSKSAIDEYRESIILLEKARKGEQVSERDIEDRLNAMSLDAVKAALQVEEQRQEVLRKQIISKKALLAVQQTEGQIMSPDDIMSTQQVSTELNSLNKTFEESLDRTDRLFASYTALDAVFAKIAPSANRTRIEQDLLNRSIERATELAYEHDQALLAARDRTKALLDERDKHIASVNKEIDDNIKLRGTLSQGARAYEVMSTQIALMSANRLLDADAAKALAERSVDSARAIDRERTAIEMRTAAAAAGRVADAYLNSQAAGMAAEARREAAKESLRTGVDVETRARQILSQQIDDSIIQSAKQIHQLELEAVQRRAVATVALKGVEALRQAEIQAKIEEATQEERMALAHADANQRVRLNAIITAKTTAITEEAQATRDLATAQGLTQQADQIEMLELELRLIGAANEQRVVQIAQAQALLDLHKKEGDALSEAERKYVENAVAISKQQAELKFLTDSYNAFGEAAEQAFERIGSAITEGLATGKIDMLELANVWKAVVSEIIQTALKLAVINPILNSAFGTVRPTLGGALAATGGVAQAAAGGGGGLGGINPLSFLNFGGGGGIYNTFATSGLGSALGLSSAYAGLGGAFGVGAATAPAALALSGPLGGFGTAVGGATASTGGLVGAAGLGGATAPGLTGLGAGLGAALPYIGIALAGLSLFSGMFQGNPSVGPVGVADFSPGLGRKRAFDVAGIDPFTADNGGNGDSLRPIAEAIADLIADSADRFSATIDESLRFRVANYGGPEKGSGRAQGFEVNAFIRGEAERRVAEGLSQEQAVFEALKFAVQEAFTFDSATLAEAAANTAATTTEEILADLDFADHFERLGEALTALGGTVDANTLALAQQTVAIQDSAKQFAETNAQPILDRFEKAVELFPATRSGEVSRRVTERGVYVAEGEGKRDQRFVEEGTDEFDRLVAAGSTAVTRIRMVTEEVDTQAVNYADNMERIRQAAEIANASVDLLVSQVTGEFEPAIRGPFQAALEQGQANLEELRTYFDDLNEQIEEANEQFPGLNAVLIDTNTVISDALTALRGQLQEDFTTSIQQQTNAATGLGALNTLSGLIDARDANIADAQAVGRNPLEVLTNTTRAQGLFDAQVRQALDGASLSDLGKLLSSGQIVDEGARVLVETILAEEALAAVRVDEVAGLQTLYAATEQFAKAANANARTLRQAAQGLLVDPNLSPLSPELRLQEARRQFEAAFSLANDADPTDELSQDAIQRLPGLSQTMLEASRAYYGSTEGYLQDFNRAQEALNNTALRQESVEQQQLDALRDIEAAIAAAGGSVVGRTPAEQASASGFNFGNESSRNQNIYNALISAGLPTPQGFGGGVSGNLGELRAANPAVDALVTAMGFATGGSFTVAGPAGNDNLLMPLRLTAGEAVNVSRGDTMQAVVGELRALRTQGAEMAQINRALLHENAQLRQQNAKWAQADMKNARRVADIQAAQPRRAYGS